MRNEAFTIGHSNHGCEQFVALLREHAITAVCDVRSRPYSRYNPQFNREELKEFLGKQGIKYVFLGAELGARSEDPACFENGKVRYGRLAQTELFQSGLERVRKGMEEHRLALMCAEKEPLECHRTILVARQLAKFGCAVRHIHGDGRLESHAEALVRLREIVGLPEQDLFRSREEMIEDAYRMQEARIAYAGSDGTAEDAAVSGAAG